MAKFPCPSKPSTCDQQPNPVTNYSSEADDSTTFIGIAWAPNVPLLGKLFDVYPCEAIAESQISQQDADLAAARAAVVCANPCSTIFTNVNKTASFFCNNGVPCFYTVPAGTFNALSQVAADRQAEALATLIVTAHPVCIGSLVGETMCLGEFFSAQIVATGPDTPFIFEIVSGSLPPGIEMQAGPSVVTFSGVPTSSGAYPFTLKASNSFGVFSTQSVEIVVVHLTTGSSLPDAFFNTPYSTGINLFNPKGSPVVWSVVAGSLPDGLTLDSGLGVISGTPSGGGGLATFTIQAEVDGAGCSQEFTINAQFINWSLVTWTNILVVPGSGPSPVATGVFSGENFNVAAKGTGGPPSKVEALGSLTFTGPAVNCKVTVTVTAAAINGGFSVFQDGVARLNINPANLPAPGVYVFPFSLIAGVASAIQLRGRLDVGDPARLWAYGTTGVLEAFSGTFANA